MNATKTALGMVGTLVLCVAALPAWAGGPAAGRDYRDGWGQSNIAGRWDVSRHDADRDARDRHDGDRDGHDRIDLRLNIGGPICPPAPQAIRYETRTQTVLVEPAHYETRTEQVLVREGRWEDRIIPGKTEWLRDSRGNYHQVQVTPDRVERVWAPPVYQERTVQVFVPDRYETRVVQVPVVVGGCDDRGDGRRVAGAAIVAGLRVLDHVLSR